MRRSPSRLFTRFKRTKTTKLSDIAENLPSSRDTVRETWHEAVKNAGHVLSFLFTGQPPIAITSGSLASLNQITSAYLAEWCPEPNQTLPPSESNEILGALIREHALRNPSTNEVAILACLPTLSTPAAIMYIASLMQLEVYDTERYLRCINLAAQIVTGVVADVELRVVQSLLRILSLAGEDFNEFQILITYVGIGMPGTLIPVEVIQGSLTKSGIGKRLQSTLTAHFAHKRFQSAFLLISWLHSVSGYRNSGDAIMLLDVHLPSWPWMVLWRPNIDRISRWEHGGFTDQQLRKLSRVIDLDGPDIVTQQESSLMMVEPRCYERVHVHPESTAMLERLLDLLYRSHLLGKGALMLFVHLCIDNLADDASLTMADDCIRAGNDANCNSLLILFSALNSRSGLGRQMENLIKALPVLNHLTGSEMSQVPKSHLADRLCGVVKDAQTKFCTQLETSAGEHFGMRIYELGNAVLGASGVHPYLPPEFLAQMRRFPPRDILEAIFDLLRDNTDTDDPRFRSYLTSTLGGQNEASTDLESVTLASIQEEVQFWASSPDIVRKDLARQICSIPGMEHALYTTCLFRILKEHDVYVAELRGLLTLRNRQTCISFTIYLANRHRRRQMQHECWLQLLVCLFNEQGPSFLPQTADSMPFEEWSQFVDIFAGLIASVPQTFPFSTLGLTEERFSWWRTLSENMSVVRPLLEGNGQSGRCAWLYFPSDPRRVVYLLHILKQGNNILPIQRQTLKYLQQDGKNIVETTDFAHVITLATDTGKRVCQRILKRQEDTNRTRSWTAEGLCLVLELCLRSYALTEHDKSSLSSIGALLQLPKTHQIRGNDVISARACLQAEYDRLVLDAEALERNRCHLMRENPTRASVILRQLGITDVKRGRASDSIISDELVDAVESVGRSQYEISFTMMGLGMLQRQALGIPTDSRLLLVRLCLQRSPRFCVHFSPSDDNQSEHVYWKPGIKPEPNSAICTARPSLFFYYINRHLHRLIQAYPVSLEMVHATILAIITPFPKTCIVCSAPLNIKLWKPATCSRDCSLMLRRSPLEVRLHNLLVDPLAVDLLLTCVYSTAVNPPRQDAALDLLPGCPVQKTRIKEVLNSFPPLASLVGVSDLRAAIRSNDIYGKEREDILSWLCLKFRGFIISAQGSFRVPLMPNTQQFLLLNSSPEREKLFNAQVMRGGSTGVVFHGTNPSRLFRIFTEGLKVMSGSAFQLHGAANGRGVYCADEQSTSLGYAVTTGQSWTNSALSNMSIMLGCELAGYTRPVSHHVIADHNRLLVRYVFLLPPDYHPPPRHHVEPAMSITFANLRSGTLA